MEKIGEMGLTSGGGALQKPGDLCLPLAYMAKDPNASGPPTIIYIL